MRKVLVVNYEKCTGCRTCEIACSFSHKKVFNPTKASVHVIKWEEEAKYVPMVCRQCKNPPCEEACPVEAIARDPETGAMLIDDELCTGCRICMEECPYGAITVDPETDEILKCDLCGGNPMCVRFCEPKALEYLTTAAFNYRSTKASAERLSIDAE
ncbi:MAG: 4Fe-4S dicluster domain-containing protein [Deltaproteobacteria bacterium]|nr:4Fe-4S dicluster domain-containing protein [Deltaproteobacteria bacterium]